MQALTLEVMLRVVFGSRDDALRDALRAPLDMTQSTPRLIAMSLLQRDIPGSPFGRFVRAVERMDAVLAERLAAPAPGSVLALLKESGADAKEVRDQVVTLLAAGHETTATALAWALERLARHPQSLSTDAGIDAAVKEVLRVRPVLSIAARKVREPYDIGVHTLPPGVYVGACLYLAHCRADVWPDPTAFRPERFEDGAPEPYTWVPFGGGTRRCLGASFAALEMREVLRAVASRFTLRPDRPRGERMRRRSITLAPARGGVVVPDALA
jgi:cytochrome P450